MTRTALTIAGFDPCGGAGVQADLRTFGALGVVGLSVVTALTVQNSSGVASVHSVAADLVAAQLEMLLRDTRPDAVKIGMLGGPETVRAVASALRRYDLRKIVLDPVLASTGGVPLLDAEGRTALLQELAPLCDLVTPNLLENKALDFPPGLPIMVKGGHREGPPDDVFTTRDGHVERFTGTRIPSPHTHGTGCFLSSAIAGLLAQGRTMSEAIGGAKRLLTTALRMPTVVGQGRGYPDPFAAMGRHGVEDDPDHQRRIGLLKGLYVVTDPDLRPDRSAEEIARAAFAGGVSALQFRDKHFGNADDLALARRLRTLAYEAGALLLVNDRVDLARAVDADGVHLGPDDLAPVEARRLLGTGKLIGVSVATVDEARAAAPWASYFGVGAIFGTTTKHDAGPPIGLDRIAEIKASFPGYPIVAIGGITAETIGEVARVGADCAAVVSAVVSAPEMISATRELCARFRRHETL